MSVPTLKRARQRLRQPPEKLFYARGLSHRPHGAAASSDPMPKGGDISATATTQEETRLPIFPTSKGSAAGCARIVTMWRPNEPVEEDVWAPLGIDTQGKRRRSHRRAWRGGLADQTVVQTLEDARSYRAFERALIGSADPR